MKNIKLLFTGLIIFMFSCNTTPVKYSEKNTDDKSIADNQKDEFINPGIMTPEVLWKLGRLSDVQISSDGEKMIFGISYYSVQKNKGNRDLFIMPTKGGEPTQLTNTKGGEYNAIWRPDGEKIAYLAIADGAMQIWEMNTDGSSKKQISKIKGGVTAFKYSPTGKRLLFTKDVKIDNNIHDIYPDLPKANAKIYDELMYRHWDHWRDDNYSHVFVADYENGKLANTKDLMEGERYNAPREPFNGSEDICWSPDGNKLIVSYKKLTGKDYALSTNSEVYIYDLSKGTSTNLTENGFDGYDDGAVWSPDGKTIVWHSMATPGFESDKNRIMVYNIDNKNITDYSKGFDQSSSSFVYSADSKIIYFLSGIEATYQIYSLNLETKEIKQITNGDHNYQSVAVAGDKLIGTKMSMIYPTEVYSIDMAGNETQLTFTNKEILDKVTPANFEKRWVKTTDGKKELVWVIFPPNFDKTKKYPTLLYCQGGPQSAVSQFFSYRWNFQVMASNGYIVVAPNRRGLPTFGQEWNDQISGDYGGQNMNDYLSAIDEIAKEDYVDNDRLGAIGASYGGYSIYWLAGHHEGRFKALISHCGIFDLPAMYTATEETFFVHHDLGGAPWDKPMPKSYKEFNPADFVGNWDTPILVITGGHDFRIPYTQSMQAFNAAQLHNVPSRFLFFPDESHFVVQPQNAILWQREFKGFLDKYLK
ncbi:MAG: peptidase S9 [Bacteroidetes bacterium]|nr:MAG: peptidase S9 [Bacteroidota bacterium]